MSEDQPLLEVDDLTIVYETNSGPITAVSDATFSFDSGEYFGLVGESGCGKSTIADALLGSLDSNGHVTKGSIRYQGEEIQDFSQNKLDKEIRWKEIAYIPQGSMDSLNPIMKVSEQAWEIAKVHTDLSKSEARRKFEEMIEIVGIPQNRIDDYPHQFSGGMQQRTIIALALFLEPKLVIADEPTTALDVIMQDQIFKYLDMIKRETDSGMMLITHDISLVFESCERMAIMHSGQVAETGSTRRLYDSPRHPYSILLQKAFPDHRYPNRELSVIEGYPPQTIGDVEICTFVDRCPWATAECSQSAPPLTDVIEGENHKAACFMKDEMYEKSNGRPEELVGEGNEEVAPHGN